MMEYYRLKEEKFEKYANDMFSILYDNMSKIAPTGNRYEEDYEFWFHATKDGLKAENRHIILCIQQESREILGYFQYSVQGNVLLMEEIQIKESYQGKYNIFRALCGSVFDNMIKNVDFVEAYANKNNIKSISILGKLGLWIVGENKRGTSYRFQGSYANLLNWYKGK